MGNTDGSGHLIFTGTMPSVSSNTDWSEYWEVDGVATDPSPLTFTLHPAPAACSIIATTGVYVAATDYYDHDTLDSTINSVYPTASATTGSGCTLSGDLSIGGGDDSRIEGTEIEDTATYETWSFQLDADHGSNFPGDNPANPVDPATNCLLYPEVIGGALYFHVTNDITHAVTTSYVPIIGEITFCRFT
jgi:hypothetical protein